MERNKPVLFAFLLLLIAAAAFYSRWILLTLLVGVGLGTLLSPVIRVCREKFHFRPEITAALLFILIMAGTGTVAWQLFQFSSREISGMEGGIVGRIHTAQERLLGFLDDYPWIKEQTAGLQFEGIYRDFLKRIFAGIREGLIALGTFIFTVTIAIYTAVDSEKYTAGFLAAFPARIREKTDTLMRTSASTLRRWFVSQLIAMTVVGTITLIALWAMGIEHPGFFGALTGLLDIVPFVGPFIALAGALLVTLGSDPDKIPALVVIFLLIQRLESDLILPLVMKGRIQLPPVVLMALMVILGSWFGVLGVLVAPPLLAIGRKLYLITHVDRMNRLTAGLPIAGLHAMDALELLKADHERIKSIFREFKNSGSQQERNRLVSTLLGELGVHSHVEETVFYPTFVKYDTMNALILNFLEDHRKVDQVIADVAKTGRWSPENIEALMIDVEAHIEREEAELFPLIRKTMKRTEREVLGRHIESQKTGYRKVA